MDYLSLTAMLQCRLPVCVAVFSQLIFILGKSKKNLEAYFATLIFNFLSFN